MKNPAMLQVETQKAAYALAAAVKAGTVPQKTLKMIHLRASQINGCGFCVDMHSKELRALGETDERMFSIAAWRDTPYYTDAERAALALTEAATRIAGRPDPVTDEIWNEAAKHYNESEMAAILLNIATINFWNRLTVSIRQVAGTL